MMYRSNTLSTLALVKCRIEIEHERRGKEREMVGIGETEGEEREWQQQGTADGQHAAGTDQRQE